MRGQGSFAVHLLAALTVVILAAWLGMSVTEWCLLTLCIGIVLAAETFNSALESLARAIDHQYNEHVREGLNIASGAVLWTAVAAAVVGAVLFGRALWALLA